MIKKDCDDRKRLLSLKRIVIKRTDVRNKINLVVM